MPLCSREKNGSIKNHSPEASICLTDTTAVLVRAFFEPGPSLWSGASFPISLPHTFGINSLAPCRRYSSQWSPSSFSSVQRCKTCSSSLVPARTQIPLHPKCRGAFPPRSSPLRSCWRGHLPEIHQVVSNLQRRERRRMRTEVVETRMSSNKLKEEEDLLNFEPGTWQERVMKSCLRTNKEGMLALVTGAAGFVGSHVSLALKRRGDGAVGIDDFNNYYDPSLKRARQAMLEKEGIFVVEGDFNDTSLLKKLFQLVPFTHVMHLGAQAGVRYALHNPMSYVHSNIAGLVNLLEVCIRANPMPAFVWASSSSVYGLNTKVPFSETDRTDQPASLYAATKKAGEGILHTYNHIYGLSVTGLRFFTVYGPWGRPDMAYFAFTRDILQGKPITIYQSRDNTGLARDFTYIDDVVKGCVASLSTAQRSTGSGGKKMGPAQLRVFNLGNTSPVTVHTLVEILEAHLGMQAKKVFVSMPENGDVPFTHADVSLAEAELGYHPTTDLKTGLKFFVDWYLQFYGTATTTLAC